MIRKTFLFALCSLCAAAAVAEPRGGLGVHAVMAKHALDMDMLSPAGDFRTMQKAGPTDAEVGDSDSFARDKTYLGVAQTEQLRLQADCSTVPPGSGPCIELNPAPGFTGVDESDLAFIELPGNATNSILCFTFTPFAQWSFSNTTPAPATAAMFLRPQVRIESETLDDPSLINPVTGLPFGGVLLDFTISNNLQQKTLQPGETESHFTALTRSCTGGLVNPRTLRGTYGLSDAQIKEFFKQPITLSFGVRGNVALVDFATYSVGIRIYGD